MMNLAEIAKATQKASKIEIFENQYKNMMVCKGRFEIEIFKNHKTFDDSTVKELEENFFFEFSNTDESKQAWKTIITEAKKENLI